MKKLIFLAVDFYLLPPISAVAFAADPVASVVLWWQTLGKKVRGGQRTKAT